MSEDPTLPPTSRSIGIAPADVSTIPAGTIVAGQYEISALLGRGGMGAVYEARDLLLHRSVALKIASDPSTSRHLELEGQALAALRHPAVVTVHAAGTWQGRAFLVLERLLGHTLEAHARERRGAHAKFAVAEAVDIVVAVAEGLRVIHDAGVSHRDLKLANVVVTPPNRYVLIDFGLVVPEFEVGLRPRPTAGTPHALAPEVILDEVRRGAGPLVDLYGLGVIAFELLTGYAPFRGATISEYLSHHLGSAAPDVRIARPDVPATVAAVVSRLLAKDPADRMQSAESVVWALRRGVSLEPGGPLAVLIVDDDSDAWERIAGAVRAVVPEASIEAVPDAETALSRLAVRVPDVVLVDLVLPVMSGVELAMWIRGERALSGSRIIVLSAAATEADKALLRQLGVTRFVDKSASLNEGLAEALGEIRQLLGRPA